MSEQTQDSGQEKPTTLTAEEQLAMLKEKARLLGISFSGNIGVETLREKIRSAMSDEKPDTSKEEVEDEEPTNSVGSAPRKLTKEEHEQKLRQDIQAEGLALVRCKIFNLNPAKNDLHGEIFTVANKYLGTVKKFIPYGEATDGGYHIPKCIYDDLKQREFQQIKTKTDKKGQLIVSTRMVPEFNLVVMEPLTEEELDELALQQAAAERLTTE